MVSIVLADKHTLFRQGIRALLEMQTNIVILGEAQDGLQALTLVEQLRPDVLILEMFLPLLNSLDVVRQIAKGRSHTYMIMLSDYPDEVYILEALANGAHGYVPKFASLTDLLQAITTVCANEQYLSPALSIPTIEPIRTKTQDEYYQEYQQLTYREREIFRLVAEAHTSRQIAELLTISRRTVEVHRANILHKLKLHSQAELIRYAMYNNLNN
jgi:DNA-binding NarL/FixJ family response regulator